MSRDEFFSNLDSARFCDRNEWCQIGDLENKSSLLLPRCMAHSTLGILKVDLEERLVDLFNIRTIPRYWGTRKTVGKFSGTLELPLRNSKHHVHSHCLSQMSSCIPLCASWEKPVSLGDTTATKKPWSWGHGALLFNASHFYRVSRS